LISGALFALIIASSARIPPIDECAIHSDFAQFRSELRRTIARRDAKALLRVVSDDVHASLGGDVGKKDFIALWGLDRPKTSGIWEELEETLRLGCVMRSGVASAPSMEHQIGDRDAFETRVALPGAVLREGPSDRTPVVARLSWDLLTLRGSWDGGPWVRVRLDDGRSGYVRERLARSPIDYRAWFHKRAGRWVMAGFLAGD